MIVDAFIVFYLAFALLWDAPETNLVDRAVKAAVRRTVIRLGLAYRWNMYSGPFEQIVEIEARLRYVDRVAVLPLPRRYEFRRYAFMLARQKSERLYRGFTDYLVSCQPPDATRPQEIILVRRVAATPSRVGGWWGHFAIGHAPAFREVVVCRRMLS